MKVETINVYKGSKKVMVNRSDVQKWQANGWKTSADRQREKKVKKEQ